ncbi:sphingosine N-acyltransferase [Malassezia vespertilionis]|uniref:TLC domain-containing protein n=1 Tax=Malassezia vespertilionis TaxID=2020962 RepID=A0A2N1J872_9BASI|nr:sphingosine N-acyltransferase [Malassezia vespertilionis]PKI82748.1 hypothetical protein MVES_003150 [Malassezia vespertilionis]WFD08205.1 sphingosine N-acyltransferase [Malassezia vespertilionis]
MPPQVAKKSAKEADRVVREKKNGFFSDMYTSRWLVSPTSAFKLALLVVLAYFAWEYLVPVSWNPFRPFLSLSYRLPESDVLMKQATYPLYGPPPTYSVDNAFLTRMRLFFQSVHTALFPNESPLLRYGKGWLDLCFIAYFVIVFSFLRQLLTVYCFKPLGAYLGLRTEVKQVRFAEQGYALFYWGLASVFGLYVMSFQDSWWYNLEHLWYQYPHWVLRPEAKVYYLLQGSYWLQQAFVMLLGLERPRKDYYELIAHHLVTLWLIGWSYFINLTMIGTTVFVCMDIPDTFLAISKMLNYLQFTVSTSIVYVCFMCIWTYFRIYLSAKTIHSVYMHYHLIPAYARTFNPFKGYWLVWWMQCHVFAPLFLLLLLNIFWYVLMWRIFLRTFQGVYKDEREDGEDEIAEKEE